MKLKIINTLKCPQCKAPISKEANKCEYCNTEFEIITTGKKSKQILKDFGWRGKNALVFNLIGVLILYSFGWILEDKKYWLATEAVLIWTVALPFWIIIMTSIWQIKWGSIFTGIIISILIFIIHSIIIMAYRKWHIRDDDILIAGIFATCVLVAWLIGRIIHHIIRKGLNKH